MRATRNEYLRIVIAAVSALIAAPACAQYTINTVAGNGTYGCSGGYSGGDGGPAINASLCGPYGVAKDGAGNLYIADRYSHHIRKVTPGGTISVVAGNGVSGFSGDGGAATSASLSNPSGVAVDGAGNLYIADFNNHRIRKVTTDGTIATVVGIGGAAFSGDGGLATNASLCYPMGVAVGGGNLYIADGCNFRIRKVNPGGIISTVAGNGVSAFSGDGGAATSASFYSPNGVAVDGAGNLYIADGDPSNRIRKVTLDGNISTVAGNGSPGYSGDDGAATSASLYSPFGVAVDGVGNLYIADSMNQRIRKVTLGSIISTVAGNGVGGYSGDGGVATSASLYSPIGVGLDGAGNLYIADTLNYRVRILTPPPGDAGSTPVGSNIQLKWHVIDSILVFVTFSRVTVAGMTMATTSATGAPPPTAFKVGTPPTYFDISTTASFSGPVTACFTYTPNSFGNPSKLHLFHSDGTGWVDVTTSLNTGDHVICGTVSSLSPFAIFESGYSAAVQQPINVDGSSVFNANRGVVPVKFTLSIDNALTCQLPTAMISLVRTAGSVPGTVTESDYVHPSDNGPNFRIASCQYVYNLASGSLGPGSYTVSILIGREPVGSGSFRLK